MEKGNFDRPEERNQDRPNSRWWDTTQKDIKQFKVMTGYRL